MNAAECERITLVLLKGLGDLGELYAAEHGNLVENEKIAAQPGVVDNIRVV